MNFLNNLEQATNKTYTENGALTNRSTLDPVLDFFSRAAAMRGNIPGAVDLFKKAYAADKNLALKALFYIRDIRGGQGERDISRACFQVLENADQDVIIKLLPTIAEYGRFDDLLSLRGDKVLGHIFNLIDEQLKQDESDMAGNRPISLLAKWLPSENANNKIRSKQGLAIARGLGLKPRQYRKKIVTLRKYIKLLEHQMSQKEWANIQYDKIPSQAHRKHVKAFYRNDEERYSKYLEAVKKGEKKINAGTLFTYEIYDLVNEGGLETADALWKALPDYTNGENALVLADVSGSMTGRPMSISVSLALYFAERNKGAFNGYYMTFSDTPLLQKVSGNTIFDKFSFIERTNVGYNTNLEAAFDAILTAVKNVQPAGEAQAQLPKVLYIISDMEFDAQMSGCSETNFESAQRKFKEAGFQLPHVVFWNVNARNDQSPATKFDNRVTLISGSSQSTFQYAVAGKNPINSMLDILNSERYAKIEA